MGLTWWGPAGGRRGRGRVASASPLFARQAGRKHRGPVPERAHSCRERAATGNPTPPWRRHQGQPPPQPTGSRRPQARRQLPAPRCGMAPNRRGTPAPPANPNAPVRSQPGKQDASRGSERQKETRGIGRISLVPAGSWQFVARARTVAGHAIPGIIVFFFWVVVAILAIILLAFIVHWAGGGVLNMRVGHFVLKVGFT
jgi:hypothetical protein